MLGTLPRTLIPREPGARRASPFKGKTMHIKQLVEKSHAMSRAKGWWDEFMETVDGAVFRITDEATRERIRSATMTLGTKLMLIVTEVSEAMECVRDDDLVMRYDEEKHGKPEGLPSELADIVIRVADLAGALGIDLEDAIKVKMAFNKRRRHRHGGRKA